ncbi:hypothetical protein [Nocardioides gansuensis]|uniref:hypothetical protein n=1 Tax=Nocardioides gansuensis TaxID=2138300 RepID=UPI0014034984|nr:hypothetical protein [Nocardioides gansuensis]
MRIQQGHSTAYRRPFELAPGPTLEVGASHTKCDIAYEVAAARPTFLVGPDHGLVPLDWNSPMIREVLPIIVFVWLHLLTRRTPMGRKEMQAVRSPDRVGRRTPGTAAYGCLGAEMGDEPAVDTCFQPRPSRLECLMRKRNERVVRR